MSISVTLLSPTLAAGGAGKGFLSSMEAQVVFEAADSVEDFRAPRALAAPDLVHSPGHFVPLVAHRVLFSLY